MLKRIRAMNARDVTPSAAARQPPEERRYEGARAVLREFKYPSPF